MTVVVEPTGDFSDCNTVGAPCTHLGEHELFIGIWLEMPAIRRQRTAEWNMTDATALRAGCRHRGLGSSSNDGSFVLGEGVDELRHQLSCRTVVVAPLTGTRDNSST